MTTHERGQRALGLSRTAGVTVVTRLYMGDEAITPQSLVPAQQSYTRTTFVLGADVGWGARGCGNTHKYTWISQKEADGHNNMSGASGPPSFSAVGR